MKTANLFLQLEQAEMKVIICCEICSIGGANQTSPLPTEQSCRLRENVWPFL